MSQQEKEPKIGTIIYKARYVQCPVVSSICPKLQPCWLVMPIVENNDDQLPTNKFEANAHYYTLLVSFKDAYGQINFPQATIRGRNCLQLAVIFPLRALQINSP